MELQAEKLFLEQKDDISIISSGKSNSAAVHVVNEDK